MHNQRFLLILWILSVCGVLAAAPGDRGARSSAVSRVTLTIMPRVEVDTVPLQLAVASSGTLCLRSNGGTDFSITVEGHSDLALDKISSSDGNCPRSSSIAFGLPLPADSGDFGNQLTLIVSAE